MDAETRNLQNDFFNTARKERATVTVFLGTTVSFVRVGAFALAHAGLGFAVFYLTRMLMKEGALLGSIAGAAVFLLGNALVILLEGLVCSIQSIRLEYYEFFSKFFSGDGKAFKPFVFTKS